MAILILDPETRTREALRAMLLEQGYSNVVEARCLAEGVRALEQERARFRMIVACLNPTRGPAGASAAEDFIARLARLPQSDLTPLLVTGPLGALGPLARARVDCALAKPFGRRQLARALAAAHATSCRRRSTIVLHGHARPKLERALAESRWSRVVVVEPARSLASLDPAELRRAGLLLISPEATLDPDWTRTFKRTPHGAVTPVVFLERDPDLLHPIRTHCKFALAAPRGTRAWKALLRGLARHVDLAWTAGTHMRAAKAALRDARQDVPRSLAHAIRELGRIVRLDPMHAEACALLGEAVHDARLLRRSIALNPAQPGAHVRLLALLADSTGLDEAREAARFCPSQPDVLIAAARAGHCRAYAYDDDT